MNTAQPLSFTAYGGGVLPLNEDPVQIPVATFHHPFSLTSQIKGARMVNKQPFQNTAVVIPTGGASQSTIFEWERVGLYNMARAALSGQMAITPDTVNNGATTTIVQTLPVYGGIADIIQNAILSIQGQIQIEFIQDYNVLYATLMLYNKSLSWIRTNGVVRELAALYSTFVSNDILFFRHYLAFGLCQSGVLWPAPYTGPLHFEFFWDTIQKSLVSTYIQYDGVNAAIPNKATVTLSNMLLWVEAISPSPLQHEQIKEALRSDHGWRAKFHSVQTFRLQSQTLTTINMVVPVRASSVRALLVHVTPTGNQITTADYLRSQLYGPIGDPPTGAPDQLLQFYITVNNFPVPDIPITDYVTLWDHLQASMSSADPMFRTGVVSQQGFPTGMPTFVPCGAARSLGGDGTCVGTNGANNYAYAYPQTYSWCNNNSNSAQNYQGNNLLMGLKTYVDSNPMLSSGISTVATGSDIIITINRLLSNTAPYDFRAFCICDYTVRLMGDNGAASVTVTT